MPQSVMPSPSNFGASENSLIDDLAVETSGADLDIDIDLDNPPTMPPARATGGTEATRPFTTAAVQPDDFSFDVPTLPPSSNERSDPPAAALPAFAVPAPAKSEPEPGTLDFDFGGVSLDLDAPPPAPSAMPRVDSSFVDFDVPEEAESADVEDADPLARKLDLADEFRQIGDLEGARDLLEEVIAQADGALKTKAQNMLDSLA